MTAKPAPPDPGVPKKLGRFQVSARLGAGAFGAVYRAYDPQLDREVALKVPRPATLDNPLHAQRFLREGRAAAQLHHPHIVPVFETGREGEQYYIASAYIAGRTLAAALDEDPPDFRRAARIVKDLAEALDHAHGLGIVHRDVKPANVLLDEHDQALLMDFGLASRLEETDKLTQDGALLGTPAYMAPELAGGKAGEARPAGDQYSLAAVLYELLCGQPPFSGPPAIVLFNAMHTEPPPPRQVRPDVPRDLETICLKGLAKRPEDRYASCRELADDLGRWLEGEPIRARRLGLGERAVRWCRREPALVISGLLIVLSLAAVVLVATVNASALEESLAKEAEARENAEAAGRAEQAAREKVEQAVRAAGQAREKLEERRRQLNEKLANLRTLSADAEAARKARREGLDRQKEALAKAKRFLEEEEAARKREEEWVRQLGDLKNIAGLVVLRGHRGSVTALAYRPGGKVLASGGADRTVRLWNLATGTEVRQDVTLRGPANKDRVNGMAFSPGGKYLAAAAEERQVILWEADALGRVRVHPIAEGPAHAVAFSPDGKWLAAATGRLLRPGFVRTWSVADGKEVRVFKGHSRGVSCLAFSADGKRLISGSFDGTLKVWDTSTGEALSTVAGSNAGIRAFVLAPAGDVAAFADVENHLKFWKTAARAPGFDSWDRTGITALAAPTDRALLAVGRKDGTVIFQQLDVAAALAARSRGLPPKVVSAHPGAAVSSLAFSPDGKHLASGSADETIRIWKVP